MIMVLNKSTKELDQSTSKDVSHKKRHADFSNLPTVLLWTIKDRLDFPNSLRFASVCKGWRDAELPYFKDARLCRESPPWLMIKDLKRPCRCDFISTTTGERYSIIHRDLYRRETLFTKQGWFLLGNNDTGLDRRLLLLNPFTKRKIELPDGVSWSLKYCRGAFTLVDGKPYLVAFAGLDIGVKEGPCIRLWTIRMNRNCLWTEHTFRIPVLLYRRYFLRSVLIIGQNIYIVGEAEASQVLVFNLSSCEWVTGRELQSPSIDYVDRNKGVLWKTDLSGSNGAMFRMNDNCRDWEKRKVEDIGNECWFVKGWPNDGYVVSKDISAAVRGDLVESGYLKRQVVPYYPGNDPKTVRQITAYVIYMKKTNVEWVDMPSN